MPNENKKLSAEEIIKQAQKVQLNIYEQKTLTDAEFWPKREQQLIDAVGGLRDQLASLEAEVKRHEFEAMERRADLQDLEDENDDLLSKTERLDVEVKRLEKEIIIHKRRIDILRIIIPKDNPISSYDGDDLDALPFNGSSSFSEPIKDIGHSEAIYEKMYEALKERVDALQGSLIKSTQETEDLKQNADGLCEALKTIVNGDIGPIGLHKAQQAITNYENQE